jgi:hypothetical protein
MVTTTFYQVLNGNSKSNFDSLEDFKKWAKGKLPTEGDNWKIKKLVMSEEEFEVECERKRINNPEIIKRIIDKFCEKANADKITFDGTECTVTDDRYMNMTISQVSIYYMAEQLGYPWEKLDDLYANKDGIMNGRGRDFQDMSTFNSREWLTNTLAPFFILKERFNIDDKDINEDMFNYGSLDRYKEVGKKHEHFDDYEGTLAGKYPEMMAFWKKHFYNSWHITWDNGLVRWLEPKEQLEAFKERIKDYPVDKVVVKRNTGDYKPCHNYTLEFPAKFDPHYKELKNTMHPYVRIPNIMFRDHDIIITTSEYYGRKVNLRTSAQCDVDEKLYEYCTKNLK